MTKSSITGININWPHDSVHGYLQQVMKEFHYLYYVCQHPPQETGVLKYMSEVFICRGGSGSGGGGGWSGPTEIVTKFIEQDYDFIMPTNVVNNQVSVRIFGGGSGGLYRSYGSPSVSIGGSSGWMNNDILTLVPGLTYAIRIGKGGVHSTNVSEGGTTSFSTFLSAPGGKTLMDGTSIGGSTGGIGGNWRTPTTKAVQFGCGGGWIGENSSGGIWGGGGGGQDSGIGAQGGYYGGGGGGPLTSADWGRNGGNGGYYGGGGGGHFYGIGGWYNDNGTWKQSGLAGNGGNLKHNPENGTNTIGWVNVLTGDKMEDFRGYGVRSIDNTNNDKYSGGGGFGGNGGKGYEGWKTSYGDGGGGGGFEGSGGNESGNAGGGGGGFGGNGGNNAGGGGGYGLNAYGGNNRGGGGGYYSSGGNIVGGGGGYGKGGSGNQDGKGVWGGGGSSAGNGGDGVCILQYYQYVK